MSERATVTGISLIILGFMVASAVPAWGLSLNVEPEQLVIEQLSPGGQGLWLSVSRERPSWRTRVVRRHGVVQAEGQGGEARVELESEPARHSIWIAIDLATGEWASWQPPDFTTGQLVPPDEVVSADGGVGATTLSIVGRSADVLLVRPGVGAWWAAVGDGTPSDADRSMNGVAQLSLGALQSLHGATSEPGRLIEGDLVVVIDPSSLAASITRCEGSSS